MNPVAAVANSGTPWLTIAGGIPLLGAIVVALLPVRFAKLTALLFTVVDLIWVIVMATQFNTSGPTYQLTEQYSWIPQFGVHYAVGVDGIALVLIGMTAVLMPVVILASWHDADETADSGGATPRAARTRSPRTYMALMLVLDTMMIGVFAATDVFLFYVFFEAMLVPMYFMIGSFGVGPRQYAAVKFLLYSLLGGLLMLVAVIALYVYSGESAVTGHHGTFLFYTLEHVALSPTVQKWLFLGFFVAFAIKAPLWPFHTWLPDAAASAQPGAAVLMLGVMDKVGTFGMIRYCLELFPDGFHYFTPLILVLSVISIIYGAIVAIGQTSMKRLIGYTSISHFGFIVLGIFALTSQGQSGATLYMVNHGFATGALFLLAGFLIVRRGSDRIADYGGVQKVAPVLAGLFLVSGLAGLSMPGLSTFVSEFLVLVGHVLPVQGRGLVRGGGHRARRDLHPVDVPAHDERAHRDSVAAMPDLRPRELLAVVPLIALIIAMGVYPKPVLDVINPAVKATMSQVGSADPVPAHPAAAQNGAQP